MELRQFFLFGVNDLFGRLRNEFGVVQLALSTLDLVFDVCKLLGKTLALCVGIDDIGKGQEDLASVGNDANRALVVALVDNGNSACRRKTGEEGLFIGKKLFFRGS